MDSLSSMSASIVLPHSSSSSNPLYNPLKRISFSSQFLKPAATSLFRLPYRNNNYHYFEESARRVKRRSCYFSHVGCCNIIRGEKGGEGGGEEEEEENKRRDEEVERALQMDGTIPGSSHEFAKQVSSRAYDMRRHLQQSFDSSSYDGTVQYKLQ